MGKQKRERRCCSSCGRDTIRPNGFCNACDGGYQTIEPVESITEDEEVLHRTHADEYNGESERDDL